MRSGSQGATTFNPFIGNHLPPRDGTVTEREEILSAHESDRALEIRWRDGQDSRHSYRWLRFNCFCRSCGSCNDGIRTIDLTLVPRDVGPASLELRGTDTVAIVWGDGHRSEYGSDWLRAHANSPEERARRRSWRPVTWRSCPIDDLPLARFAEVTRDDERRLEMFEGLRDYGLVRIAGATPDPERTEQVANLFGPLHETTLYGYISDVESKPVSKLGGETAIHQHPHCDDVFHYTPPGIVAFHCIVNNTDEGGSRPTPMASPLPSRSGPRHPRRSDCSRPSPSSSSADDRDSSTSGARAESSGSTTRAGSPGSGTSTGPLRPWMPMRT